jgi:fructose-bisphosphate aldolase class II
MHDHGLWVDVEGTYGARAPGVRTDSIEAQDLVGTTGGDALATAVGSSDAMLERTAAVGHFAILVVDAMCSTEASPV